MSAQGDSPQQPRISVRIPKKSDLRRRLDHAIEITGIDEPTLVLRCVEAAVDYIEKNGEITLPLIVSTKSEHAKKKSDYRTSLSSGSPRSSRSSPTETRAHGLNEPSAEYKTKAEK